MAKPVWEANSEYIIPSSEIEIGQEIARGGYGTVYKGKCRGQVVAIKKLHNQALSGDKLDELKKEVQIMSQLRHPGILLLMGVCTEPDNVALVMEFVEGKSLYTVLHEEKVQLTTTQRFQLAKEIAKGCYWLHCLSPPIIHRDIKPANILVDTHFRVQLCDFGLSCVKEVSNERKAKVVGSPYWMAPEVLTGHPNTEKSDVYAYAVLLWEIFTGDAPNKDVTDYRGYMYDVVNQGRRPPLPDGLFPAMKDLISIAWAQDPKKRPNFATILELLDEVFIQMVIPEQPGRDMWKEFKAESHYPFFVGWDLFISKFYNKLKILALPGDIGVRCLRDFIAERSTDMTSSNAVKLIVNAQKFGDFLDRFGPVWADPDKPMNIINEFKELCANEWFHGEVDTEEVRLRLGEKPSGSFLVRLSSAARSFTISKVNEEAQIIHQRVFRKGDAYVIVDNNKPVAFNSLKELIDGVRDMLNITKPVGDKRIFAVHFQEKGEASKPEEYVNCEFNSSAFPALVPATPSPKVEERTKKPKKDKKGSKKDKQGKKKGKEGKKKKKV